MTQKVAIVLFNLGGPDSPDAVKPFLFNLFNDPAIIGAPGPIRWCLAKFISSRRAPVAREIYDHIGGRSPLVPLTEDQAKALGDRLIEVSNGNIEPKVVLAMRYWHPFADAAVKEVLAFEPDEVILLPLYPQFSTTTSGSSIKDWHRAASEVGLATRSRAVCCYPTEPGWVEAQADLIKKTLGSVSPDQKARVLFSAHGLPKKVIEGGDPYQWQVEQTAKAVVDRLNIEGLDWQVCYQSRVGPLQWIGPSTEDELERAAKDQVSVVLTPIAFVSEHSETLVELDIEYREEAEKLGIPQYLRVPAVATHPAFISGLANIVMQALERQEAMQCGVSDDLICPKTGTRCAIRKHRG